MSFKNFIGKKHTKELERKISENPNISAILTNTDGEITGIIESKHCPQPKKLKEK